jgi:hypothetical protein
MYICGQINLTVFEHLCEQLIFLKFYLGVIFFESKIMWRKCRQAVFKPFLSSLSYNLRTLWFIFVYWFRTLKEIFSWQKIKKKTRVRLLIKKQNKSSSKKIKFRKKTFLSFLQSFCWHCVINYFIAFLLSCWDSTDSNDGGFETSRATMLRFG